MNVIIQLAIAVCTSVLAVHWIYAKVLKVAMAKGLTDNPDARKHQTAPVPVLGGIAVFFGLLFGLLAFTSINFMANTPSGVEGSHLLGGTAPVLLASCILLYVGALDDILDLAPRSRLVIEVLVLLGVIFSTGMCVDSFHGLWGIHQFSWWIAVPLTVFAAVGIINSYNMVDGVNGLSSGLCILGSSILGIVLFLRDDLHNAAMAFCFAGALLPFYVHNVFGKRSKMFIGDAGTMVMGMLVSWFIIRLLSSQNIPANNPAAQEDNLCLVAMMLAIASVPVADTLRVMAGRVMRGVSPLQADRTHLHHGFMDTGVSHFVTSLCEVLLNFLVFGIWALAYRLGMSQEEQLYLTIGAAVLLVWGAHIYLNHQKKHPSKAFERFSRWSQFAHLCNKKWWGKVQTYLDKEAD